MPQLRALVVEDDPDIQRLLRHHLERLHLDVEIASTGEQALASVGRSVPDIVLLDLHLPGIQGRDVMRVLRAHVDMAATPIVVVSIADADPADVGLVDAWLVKPFTGRAVVREIERLLPLGAALG